MMSFIQVMTTTPSSEEAQKIAEYLVTEKLAACVQITSDVKSTYLWKNKMETSRECLCFIKTRADLFPQVETAIKKLHSYETPEIIALPIINGSADYFKWLDDSLVRKL